MPKINPHNIQADWSLYEKRAPWGYISSAQLAKILNVHIQTISNWKLRGILPEPEENPRFKGNKNHYKIASIKSWLSGKDPSDITWDWIRTHLPEGVKSVEEAEYLVKQVHSFLGVEKV